MGIYFKLPFSASWVQGVNGALDTCYHPLLMLYIHALAAEEGMEGLVSDNASTVCCIDDIVYGTQRTKRRKSKAGTTDMGFSEWYAKLLDFIEVCATDFLHCLRFGGKTKGTLLLRNNDKLTKTPSWHSDTWWLGAGASLVPGKRGQESTAAE